MKNKVTLNVTLVGYLEDVVEERQAILNRLDAKKQRVAFLCNQMNLVNGLTMETLAVDIFPSSDA